MKKNIVQDVMFSKRSIKDVELPSKKKPLPQIEPEVEYPVNDHIDKNFSPRSQYTFDYDVDTPSRSESHFWLWISLAIFVIAAGFGISALFVSAQVTITPKIQITPINLSLTAPKNPPNGTFGYQVVSVSASVEKSVPAGNSQKVDTKATGTIIIYNNTSSAQKLIANTRFQTSNGLIYRIGNAVTVPGAKTQNGKSIPGNIEVTVTADASGDTYNIPPSDLTIPGLKDDPRFTSIFGRSKTSFSGGFSGMSAGVDQTTQVSTQKELETQVKDVLKKQIQSQIPANFLLYDAAIVYTYSPLIQKPSLVESQTTLRMNATASAILFDKTLLSQSVVTALSDILNAQDNNIRITNLSNLSFMLASSSQINQSGSNPITFTLKGDATAQWMYDESKLKTDILGIKKSTISDVLSAKYPSIQDATVSIHPFWKQSFPTDPAQIHIINKNSVN